jgi:UDP-N-acetylmuramoyl-tripeptide--D-alanyl-D-alanine ligase
LAFIGQARAPRKTMVFGTISDYPGSAGSRYRRMARAALELADRVVFVGPQSGHTDRLRQGAVMDRLFTFASVYQASAFLAADTVAAELICIKASQRDHLERIMLAQCRTVMCWHERCGKYLNCPDCPNYRLPHPPPAWAAPLPFDRNSSPSPHPQALDGAPLASRVPSA